MKYNFTFLCEIMLSLLNLVLYHHTYLLLFIYLL